MPYASAAGPTPFRSTAHITPTGLPRRNETCRPALPWPAPVITASGSLPACSRGVEQRVHCCNADPLAECCMRRGWNAASLTVASCALLLAVAACGDDSSDDSAPVAQASVV